MGTAPWYEQTMPLRQRHRSGPVAALIALVSVMACDRAPHGAVDRPSLDAAVDAGEAVRRQDRPTSVVAAAGTGPTRSLETNEDVASHVSRAADLSRRGFSREAIAELRIAAARAPRDPEIAAALARALVDAGDAAAAVDEFRRALALKPNDEDVQFGLSRALLERGDATGARAALSDLAAKRADDPRVQQLWAATLGALGNTLAANGDARGAVPQLAAAASAAPENATLQVQLGTALAQSGQLAPARAALERATALAPEDAQAWRNLAVVREQQGDLTAAADAWAGLLKNVNNADPQGTVARRIAALRSNERVDGQAGGLKP